MENNERVTCFDGLKGLSAIIVMFAHFFICFAHISWLQTIPFLRILFDGGMAVFIFILLSSFGICASLDKQNVETAIVRIGIKRYFRLTLPLLWPSVLGFLCCLLGMNYNVAVGTSLGDFWTQTLLPSEPQIQQFTSGVAVGVLRGSALINPLWMLKYIFLGTFITIPLFYTVRKIRSWGYKSSFLLLFTVLFYSESIFFAANILGILLYILQKKDIFRKRWVVVLFLVAIGAIEVFVKDVSSIVMLVKGILIVLIVGNCTTIRRLMSTSCLLRLNDISYQLYLVHTIIIATFCCYLYLNVAHTEELFLSCFGGFLVITLFFSVLFSKLDRWISSRMSQLYKLILSI